MPPLDRSALRIFSTLPEAIKRARSSLSIVSALALMGCGGAGGDSPGVSVVSSASSRTLAASEIVMPAPTPTPAPTLAPASVTPIASNFDTSAWLWSGFSLPNNMAPDVVGAFRFVCSPGQVSYDDPILYPGVKGGSSHLHQFYGNTGADYASTYASLRTTGESTCSNKLNRSAYWIPAFLNGAGKAIIPDYISIYYKRHADGDPACMLEAAKGCADIPAGLRVVAGFDMKRMNEAQPENRNYTFRCISPNKPSIHHSTVAEAIADCGGSGQIMAFIGFGSCWNGELDSADHRSHLVVPQYVGHSYPQCDAAHPYLIPELSQQIAYTVAADDGPIYFASDRMNGMNMAGGSSFHSDYMEGWDPNTRLTWERNCIGKLLNCSDGQLGDGTMMKRGALPALAEPRLKCPPLVAALTTNIVIKKGTTNVCEKEQPRVDRRRTA